MHSGRAGQGGAALEVKKLKGAEIICESLIREGVEVLFGHPGGAILPFYDALWAYPQLRHILVRHEQAAAHAADGYSRVSGKVGVCVATSGPGATNLVTGIMGAKAGLGSPDCHHRTGGPDGPGFRGVPGMRHLLHHLYLHQEEHHGHVGPTIWPRPSTRLSSSLRKGGPARC